MGSIPAFNPVTCSMRLFFESVAEKTPVEEGMLINQGSGACSKCGPGNGFRASGGHFPQDARSQHLHKDLCKVLVCFFH